MGRPGVWSAACLGALLLSGCVGQPQTYGSGRPIVLTPRVAAPRVRPAPATRPAVPLSAAEKQRLFRQFQETQANDAGP